MFKQSFHFGYIVLIASLLIILPIVFPGAASATLIVKDGFEDTIISSQWGTPVISGAISPYGYDAITKKQAFTGTSSMQLDWLALNTSSIYFPKSLPNLNEVYLRFAVKWSPGFQFTPGTTAAKKIWRTFGSSGSSDDIVFLARKTGTVASGLRFSLSVNQMYLHGLAPNLDENVGGATLIETDKWYCFDWHIVGGSGTGRVEGWINGVKKWDYYNLYATSSPMTSFNLGGNISPDRPTINQTEWYDNVGLSTAAIGATDLPGCTVAAPTGVVANGAARDQPQPHEARSGDHRDHTQPR